MSQKCSWCHISPGEVIIHETLREKHQRFCKYCHTDYLQLRETIKSPSGVIPCCILKNTNDKYFLFGLEKSGWCHLQGNDDLSDVCREMTACREGAEESCYAIGTPQYLMNEYFKKKKYSEPGGWGAYVLDFGEMSLKSMNHIIEKHKENLIKIKSLDREPTKCEKEMLELKWCSYKDFKASVTNCYDKNNLIINGFDNRKFRPWCLRYYKYLVAEFIE